MNKLSTQLWISRGEHLSLDETLIEPISNNAPLWIKGLGGLWTSSWLGKEEGSEWVQWSISNGWGLPLDDIWRGFILIPKDDLNILVIDTLKDMHIMFDTYGYKQFPDLPFMSEAIDFESMAKDYDGMWLTSRGQRVTRHGFGLFDETYFDEELKPEWKEKTMRNLYGWDAESTFHFRWNFKEIKPIELKI